MASNREWDDPMRSYREIHEHFQKRMNDAMLNVSSEQQVDLRKPLIFERYEILMWPLVEENEEIREELEEIDEDESYLERAKALVHRRDQEVRKIARRLRRHDKLKVLQKLAFKRGLIGKEHQGPVEAEDVIGDDALGLNDDGEIEDEPGSSMAEAGSA